MASKKEWTLCLSEKGAAYGVADLDSWISFLMDKGAVQMEVGDNILYSVPGYAYRLMLVPMPPVRAPKDAPQGDAPAQVYQGTGLMYAGSYTSAAKYLRKLKYRRGRHEWLKKGALYQEKWYPEGLHSIRQVQEVRLVWDKEVAEVRP